MNNLSSLDIAIAVGGYGAGLALGCLSNVRKTGSLFGVPKDAPRNVPFVVKVLEMDRDKSGQRNFKTPSDVLKPVIWNPIVPLEHLAPLTLLIITEVSIAALSAGATAATTGILIATYTFKIIVLPVAFNALVLCGGILIRFRFEPYKFKTGIDPSGHALAQSAAAVYKLFVFSALSSLKLSSNLYRATAAVTTLSDYLWTYRTGSSYHSVMDMTLTTLFMGISFKVVYVAHQALALYI